jgi:hypothetical protein
MAIADKVIAKSGQAPCRFGEIVPNFNWPFGEQLLTYSITPAGLKQMDMHPRALEYPESSLDRMIRDEAELTAGVKVVSGKSYGFFTDTTLVHRLQSL